MSTGGLKLETNLAGYQLLTVWIPLTHCSPQHGQPPLHIKFKVEQQCSAAALPTPHILLLIILIFAVCWMSAHSNTKPQSVQFFTVNVFASINSVKAPTNYSYSRGGEEHCGPGYRLHLRFPGFTFNLIRIMCRGSLCITLRQCSTRLYIWNKAAI